MLLGELQRDGVLGGGLAPFPIGRAVERRCDLDQSEQFVPVMPGRLPVDDVALGRQTGQLDHFDRGGHGPQRLGDVLGMAAPGRVLVRQDDDLLGVEVGVVLTPPLARPHGIAGGGQAPGEKRQHFRLAFDDEDGLGL